MKIVRKILAVIVGLMGAVVAFWLVNYVALLYVFLEGTAFWMTTYVILCISIPLLVFYFTARIIGWRLMDILDKLRRLPRWILVVIVIAYIFTWVFGVPAVQTSTNASAVDSYKQGMKYGHPQHWEVYPQIRTTAAFPLLPGLIVSYHEYQIAGKDGWGGWEIHLWYFVGVKEIGSFTIWIS